jgi:hypothetical protein
VAAGSGTVGVPFRGLGSCTLGASLSDGGLVNAPSAEVVVEGEAQLEPPGGRGIGPAGLTLTDASLGTEGQLGVCPVDYPATDGKCDGALGDVIPLGTLLDIDCFSEIRWEKSLYEPDGTVALGEPALGVGLISELQLSVLAVTVGVLEGQRRPPSQLSLTSSVLGALDWVDLGCLDDQRRLRLLPRASADVTLSLDASNVLEGSSLALRLRDVVRSSLLPIDSQGQATPTAPGTISETSAGTVRHYFTGSNVSFIHGYHAEDGERLRGLGGLQVTGDAAGSVVVRSYSVEGDVTLLAGPQVEKVVFSSSSVPDTHEMLIDDVTKIADFEVTVVERPDPGTRCIYEDAKADDGLIIQGFPQEGPRLRGAVGELLVDFESDSFPSCFAPIGEQAVELEVEWGNVRKSLTWEAAPP